MCIWLFGINLTAARANTVKIIRKSENKLTRVKKQSLENYTNRNQLKTANATETEQRKNKIDNIMWISYILPAISLGCQPFSHITLYKSPIPFPKKAYNYFHYRQRYSTTTIDMSECMFFVYNNYQILLAVVKIVTFFLRENCALDWNEQPFHAQWSVFYF